MQSIQEIITGQDNDNPIYLAIQEDERTFFTIIFLNHDAWHHNHINFLLYCRAQNSIAKIEDLLTSIYINLSFFSQASADILSKWIKCMKILLKYSPLSIKFRAVANVILLATLRQQSLQQETLAEANLTQDILRFHAEFAILLKLLEMVNPPFSLAIEAYYAKITQQDDRFRNCLQRYTGPTLLQTNVNLASILLIPFLQQQFDLHYQYYLHNLQKNSLLSLYTTIKLSSIQDISLTKEHAYILLKLQLSFSPHQKGLLLSIILLQFSHPERISFLEEIKQNFSNRMIPIAIGHFLTNVSASSKKILAILQSLPYPLIRPSSYLFITGFKNACSQLRGHALDYFSTFLLAYFKDQKPFKIMDRKMLWALAIETALVQQSPSVIMDIITILIKLIKNKELSYRMWYLPIFIEKIFLTLPKGPQNFLMREIFLPLRRDPTHIPFLRLLLSWNTFNTSENIKPFFVYPPNTNIQDILFSFEQSENLYSLVNQLSYLPDEAAKFSLTEKVVIKVLDQNQKKYRSIFPTFMQFALQHLQQTAYLTKLFAKILPFLTSDEKEKIYYAIFCCAYLLQSSLLADKHTHFTPLLSSNDSMIRTLTCQTLSSLLPHLSTENLQALQVSVTTHSIFSPPPKERRILSLESPSNSCSQ